MNKLEIVKNYWAAESRKDLSRVLAHFAPDAEFVSPTMRLSGRDNIRKFYEGMVNGFQEISVTPVNTIEQGANIAVEYECRLVRLSGEIRNARGFNFFEIRDGVIQSLRCYFNPADF